MWRLICVASLTISLLAAFSATAYAQALAPSGLNLASHDQKTADDMVQVITEKSAGKNARLPAWAVSSSSGPDRLLIARIIIRLKSRRSAEHLISLDDSTAVTPRHELVLFTIRRYGRGAA